MPAGLQVFTSSGLKILDTSSLIGRQIGSFTVPANSVSGAVTVVGLDQGIPFVIPQVSGGTTGVFLGTQVVNAIFVPKCTFSGTTVSWSRNSKGSAPYTLPAVTFFVGVY
ncbi:hypothetical protein [Vibrio salinus]|uniref:hypothetical protein n=1 Tax=Vibrio salinus TaxID=2899784 RepID=UPI001E38C7DD|nr:hypothetical protein [Vibrio salinus]MCE0495775.1 hypothetical protein [Vibrio salinus]